MTEDAFPNDEFLAIARSLEIHHAIFNRLWNISKPKFSNKVPTAAVYFDRVGDCIDFIINPDFWKTLNDTQKQFVISHECLHVILYHGFRISSINPMYAAIANKALDVVVNHSLVDKFQFNRKEIDPTNKYCWVDTVFQNDIPESGKYYEYYYNLLIDDQIKSAKNKSKASSAGGRGETVDSHDGLESFNEKGFEDILKQNSDILENIKEFLETHYSDELQNASKIAGCDAKGLCKQLRIGKVKPKKKWETVIKKWSSKYLKEHEVEQWAVRNRRMRFMPEDFFLPTEQEAEHFDEGRIEVWFFQDTSGSCGGFIDRFFRAAKSLPKERFDVKMHCFDTRVFETTLESGKLFGFGGTSFSCIEEYIRNYMRKHDTQYPKAVFIITDGYGNHVSPLMPEKWHWFIDGGTHFVPKESKHYDLKKFE